jgi:hypothetical protein
LRRKRWQGVEKLIGMKAERDRLMLEFCCMAAEFADTGAYEGSGAASAVEWISEKCHMTQEDAAESIAVGRRLLARAT